MTHEERLEIAAILGGVVECLLHVPDVPQDKLDKLTDAVSAFTLKGMPKE